MHQPNDPLFGENIIADESIDPTPYWFDDPYDHCIPRHYCRWSDAAFAELRNDEDIDLGHIGKPEDEGEYTVYPVGTIFEIVGELGTVSESDELYLIGKTLGWVTGEVVDDCARADVIVTPYINVCTVKVQMTGGHTTAGGDSGGPWVKFDTGNDVELAGIHTGADASYRYFSAIGFIYLELGPSSTWNSCIPAEGC